MIEFHAGLEVAREIINRLTDDLKMMTLEKNYTISNYVNGREVGHSINWFDFKEKKDYSISFAENRNTDNIIVYYGTMDDNFSITEDAYANKKYFEADAFDEAVQYIRSILVDADQKHIDYIQTDEYKKEIETLTKKFGGR